SHLTPVMPCSTNLTGKGHMVCFLLFLRGRHTARATVDRPTSDSNSFAESIVVETSSHPCKQRNKKYLGDLYQCAKSACNGNSPKPKCPLYWLVSSALCSRGCNVWIVGIPALGSSSSISTI